MGEASSPLVGLVKLSRIDASLARITAERRKLEEQLAEKVSNLKKLKEKLEDRQLSFRDRQTKYQREEKRLKEEEQKLIDRRKALASFSNYKLQQAAEKEIEQSSKQLSMQETTLLQSLEGIEQQEQELLVLQADYEKLQKECADFDEEVKGTFSNLEERAEDKQSAREKVLPLVNQAFLTQYKRVSSRYALDPVVAVENQRICSGCFIQVPPQMIVQIAKGADLVNCRGCGRILYLVEEIPEESDE